MQILKSMFNKIGLKYIDKKSLLLRFIDPAHIVYAQAAFPRSPWNHYLTPNGQYPKAGWKFFQNASAYVVTLARQALYSTHENDLTVQILLDLYSVLILGKKGHAYKMVSSPFLTYNDRSYKELHLVFGTGRRYLNPDGLDFKVEGFWPCKMNSLSLFGARLDFISNREAVEPAKCRKAIADIRKILYKRINTDSSQWHVYWLMSPEERLNQLEFLLGWYNKQVCILRRLQQNCDISFEDKVIHLAVKMQRYLDVTHIFPNGSGRMSRLIQDFTFLRFGMLPPKPILYKFRGKYYENGTYLPFSKALDMLKKGYKCSDS